ncbi:hypothetical protein AB0N05_37720 [Nocardia sp. NPDC051030]|uniref:hypothetical protein n=1 Tax=Nocardia sp. NPDC051030 TaxID=3155162 RepID=UPI0034305C9B
MSTTETAVLVATALGAQALLWLGRVPETAADVLRICSLALPVFIGLAALVPHLE